MVNIRVVGQRWAVVLLVAMVCGLEYGSLGSLWAADTPARGNKAALLDRAARTGDPVYLLESLENRRRDLDKRAKLLDLREADLKRLENKLAERIVALEKLRADLRSDLAQEAATDSANIAHLAKIFSGMKVKAAANGLRAMDRETAVLVLKVMREKIAAKILSKMTNEDAVQLANELGMPQSEKGSQR